MLNFVVVVCSCVRCRPMCGSDRKLVVPCKVGRPFEGTSWALQYGHYIKHAECGACLQGGRALCRWYGEPLL